MLNMLHEKANDLEYVKSSMDIEGNLQSMTAKMWSEHNQIIRSSCPFLPTRHTVCE